jgi:hypothetical protein
MGEPWETKSVGQRMAAPPGNIDALIVGRFQSAINPFKRDGLLPDKHQCRHAAQQRPDGDGPRQRPDPRTPAGDGDRKRGGR